MHTQVDEKTILRAPAVVVEPTRGAQLALDPASPHWIATDERGVAILRRLDGRTPLGAVVRTYAAETGLDMTRAWLQVETFIGDAASTGRSSVVDRLDSKIDLTADDGCCAPGGACC